MLVHLETLERLIFVNDALMPTFSQDTAETSPSNVFVNINIRSFGLLPTVFPTNLFPPLGGLLRIFVI